MGEQELPLTFNIKVKTLGKKFDFFFNETGKMSALMNGRMLNLLRRQ